MGNGVKLGEPELVVGTNVDVGSPVLCHVAVLGCRED